MLRCFGRRARMLAEQEAEPQRVFPIGSRSVYGNDNAIYTSKYNLFTFLPVSIREQFRRNGNLYFLVMGMLMFIGWNTPWFDSSVSPWTTLGPLAIVISISLAQEGAADMKRHRSDRETNNFQCVILRREEDLEEGAMRDTTIMNGNSVVVGLRNEVSPSPSVKKMSSRKTIDLNDNRNSLPDELVSIAFTSIRRMDIGTGEIVLVKNREMVPADIILLASSGENGAAYIETSPIDGETNLKLRTCPQLPPEAIMAVSTPRNVNVQRGESYSHPKVESIERAVKRLTRISLLGYPSGVGASHADQNQPLEAAPPPRRTRSFGRSPSMDEEANDAGQPPRMVTSLTSEQPNASVNTFSGKITLPPLDNKADSTDIALGAENILLRGSVLRNTEWAIGVACFTGKDTKLARNSVKTPSKFSRLDVLMNRTVLVILVLMIVCVVGLAIIADIEHKQKYKYLYYGGFNDKGEKWPYLPDDFEAPEWKDKPPSFFRFFFTFITLLNNFVPLSLYVTVEIITLFMMFLIGWDKDMYHEETNTPAAARSTIVTDLGQVKYVFSDKTGTLTQNVMKFKRCSVDGLIFGAPIGKADRGQGDEDKAAEMHAFHPLKQLLVGSVELEKISEDEEEGIVELRKTKANSETNGFMTFNAEMFMRVMSICHTVVVEKEIDASKINMKSDDSISSSGIGIGSVLKKFNRSRNNTLERLPTRLDTVTETPVDDELTLGSIRTPVLNLSDSDHPSSVTLKSNKIGGKNADGSPAGFAFQAESPDEGALVSAASIEYDFQLIGRDSNGVTLRSMTPSLLSVGDVAKKLKDGSVSARDLAAETASPTMDNRQSSLKKKISEMENNFQPGLNRAYDETWPILAVNKFDSDRKRMSVVVRSPPSLGSIPMLLCKGADSSMLLPEISEGGVHIMSGNGLGQSLDSMSNHSLDAAEEWESTTLLGLQSHLGIFATEGLRTLVLGIRILTEEECSDWLAKFEQASTSIKNRSKLLKKVATEIETKLHIVGATAIEDKLQDGVPDTISNIGKAGIKLWVLTGDKRETAIEIGYSTKVLNPKMHLTDVADSSEKRVKALVAMEFMRLVKMGKLPKYQKNTLEAKKGCCKSIFSSKKIKAAELERLKEVRELAERLLNEYLESPEGQEELELKRRASVIADESMDFDGGSDMLPAVFNRARSARDSINAREGNLSQSLLRSLTLGSLTADSVAKRAEPVVDEDTLSLMSFVPGKSGNVDQIFNKKKRTLLERMFAVDRDVRKGNLVKHLTKEKKAEFYSNFNILPQDSGKDIPDGINAHVARAFVIEGSALAYFLEDSLLEELLFSVASNCNSVIACRVSPKQKALLVKLVKEFVKPEPVTLAIGDGANDVGMIQEAQVGVGISGLEGQQAVNASDFSIAQFRYLEDLLLIHGRWNFMRLSKTVLFSFYKNAVLAGLLMLYCRVSFYGGTPVFDMWVLSAFNFVCAAPIGFFGMFDRDLEKDYVRRNPHLYAAGPNNEHMSMRTTLRWIALVFVHVNVIYYLCASALDAGGGTTSAFKGLMSGWNRDNPGDGDGSGLKIFGTTVFIVLNWTLAIKVLFESSSIIMGQFPACTFRAKVGEGFWSRVGYSWVAVVYVSIGFNFFFLYTYQLIGRDGASDFSSFSFLTYHLLHTRTISWVVIILVTVAATSMDVIGKLFANMFFPTQTQIHREIQHFQFKEKKRRGSVRNLEPPFGINA